MTDREPAPGATPPAPERPGRSGKQKVVLTLVGLAAVALTLLFVTSFLPRWWAHRIADRVDSSYTSGIVFGLVIGAVFTAVPLAIARFAVRRHVSWKRRGILVAAALLVAAPNLITLGIVLGRGGGARDARTILLGRGTGFRGASLIGAVIGVLAFAGGLYLLASRRNRRREIDHLRGELRRRDGAEPSA